MNKTFALHLMHWGITVVMDVLTLNPLLLRW